MSALTASPSKKARTKTLVPKGVGIAVRTKVPLRLCHEDPQPPNPRVWVAYGDRTNKNDAQVPGTAALWALWEALWVASECPHNFFLVALLDGVFDPLFVPASVCKSEGGRRFSAVECGAAMLKHVLYKTWVPTFLPNAENIKAHLDGLVVNKGRPTKEEKALLRRAAEEFVDQWTLEDGTNAFAMQFVDLCVKFTKLVWKGDANGVPFLVQEIPRGGKEDETLDAAAVRELGEEACVPQEYAENTLRCTGDVPFVSPASGRSSLNRTYECLVPEELMLSWNAKETERRKTLTNWFCPFPWFSFLGGIDKGRMEKLKGLCETCNGRFVSEEEAHQILDPASLNILGWVLRH